MSRQLRPHRSVRAYALITGRAALAFALLAAVLFVTAVHTPAARAAASTTASTAAAADDSNGLAAKPYMGWTSWDLEATTYPGVDPAGTGSWLTEANVLQQANALASKLEPYGYDYVDIDAGWSNAFDAYGRPIADKATFPDGIAYIANYVHKKGLKLGIYLAVGLAPAAYGTGSTPIYGAPGCTTSDIVYPGLPMTNGWNDAYQIDYASPCAQAYVNSIADEFAGWGVDFLKLDGVGPGSFQGGANHDNTPDVAAWSKALKQTGRPIQFVISWALSHNDVSTWAEYTNGWRIDTDVDCYCNTLVTWQNSVEERWNDVVQWIPDAGPGHWNNLDSVDVGDGAMDGLTDAERQSYLTLWAIEDAPLYVGDDLTKLDRYGLSLLTNREVIAVDQAGNPAKPVSQRTEQQVWSARNSNGSYTVALFNLGDSTATVTANWSDLGITGPAAARDLWSHTNLGNFTGSFSASLPEHGSRLLTITPLDTAANSPTEPANLHGTASTGSSISLAWDPSAASRGSVTGYHVYIGGKLAASVSQPSVTLTGLAAGTSYSFTVTAYGSGGSQSARSDTLALTTPAAGGPASYEAESPANTVGGGAGIASCSACSGGEKVGYLGGTGYLIFNGVTAPRAGTYLMQVSYVDGDSGRPGLVTVDGGTPFDLFLPGTNDNNWDAVQTATVPVQLNAGANTIEFGNPDANVYDVDKIAV